MRYHLALPLVFCGLVIAYPNSGSQEGNRVEEPNEERTENGRSKRVITLENFARWPDAVVPFYIDRDHFDADQATYIMTTLSLLAFKTCLKFAPVLDKPAAKEHVMVFRNPGGIRKCDVDNSGHSIDEPHYVNLGFECLRSPQIEMKIMQALGLPFEHNRPMRDIFIDVQPENVESGYLQLFTKDEDLLPRELQLLPYDLNSVTHFGEREFSRNGHRTIIIKDPNIKQERTTFSETDLQKIEIVYGSQCLKRDRQEKVDMCRTFPSKPLSSRKKRNAEIEINGRKILQDTNLRINREIEPQIKKNVLEELGIDSEVNATVHEIYHSLSLAFKNAVRIYCNNTETVNTDVKTDALDVLNIKTAVTTLTAKLIDELKNDRSICINPDTADAFLKDKLLNTGVATDKDIEPKVEVTKEALKEIKTEIGEVKAEIDRIQPQLRRWNDRDDRSEEIARNQDSYESGKGKDKRYSKKYSAESEAEEWSPVIVNMTKENRVFYNDRKWPSNVVRYIIDDTTKYDIEDLRRRLSEVNDILKKQTCTRLHELRGEDEGRRHRDYLVLDTSPDYVTGRVGGRQQFGSVEMFRGGQHRQHTAMMVMAMLGFYFEVARHDRDEHIRVHFRHIRPNKLHHFEKIRDEATLPLPYDYASATHPAWQFWRKADKTGISSVATYKHLDSDGKVMRSLGQNTDLLSELDIVKINSVYGVDCFKNKT